MNATHALDMRNKCTKVHTNTLLFFLLFTVRYHFLFATFLASLSLDLCVYFCYYFIIINCYLLINEEKTAVVGGIKQAKTNKTILFYITYISRYTYMYQWKTHHIRIIHFIIIHYIDGKIEIKYILRQRLHVQHLIFDINHLLEQHL